MFLISYEIIFKFFIQPHDNLLGVYFNMSTDFSDEEKVGWVSDGISAVLA